MSSALNDKIKKINALEDRLNFPRQSLLNCMLLETSGSLSPSVYNGVTQATGLIQFMPSTAISLGTTVAQLRVMSFDNQLLYVEKYFVKNGYVKKIKSSNDFLDIYLAIFFPVAMGKPDSYILKTSSISAATIAKQNPLYDIDKDKDVEKNEIRKRYISTVNGIRQRLGLTQWAPSSFQLPFKTELLAVPLGLLLLAMLIK